MPDTITKEIKQLVDKVASGKVDARGLFSYFQGHQRALQEFTLLYRTLQKQKEENLSTAEECSDKRKLRTSNKPA